jgi:hypothetical protein
MGCAILLVIGLVLWFRGRDTVRVDRDERRPRLARDVASDVPKADSNADGVHSVRAEAVSDTIALESKLISRTGISISGASIRWIPFSRPASVASAAWPGLNWESLASQMQVTSSDLQGTFTLSLARADLQASASVVWITHPAYLARSFTIDAGASTSTLPTSIVLEACGAIRAHVVGPDSNAVAGASVYELFDLSGADSLNDTDPQLAAKRVVRLEFTSDAQGDVQLSPLPGKHCVFATARDLRSTPWIGNAPAQIVLKLTSQFTAVGRVVPSDGQALESGLSVRCLSKTWSDTTMLDRCAVRNSGEFGPLAIPLVGSGSYVFQLEGGTSLQERIAISKPSPGERVSVEFHPRAAAPLTVAVVGEHEAAVADATVWVQWSADQAWQDIERRTNAHGVAQFSACPAATLFVRVEAPGFVPGLVSNIDATSPLTQPIRVQLTKGARVEGRCTHEDKPVSDFTVQYWQGDPQNVHKIRVHDSRDGTFTSNEVETGDITFVATSEEYPQSDPVIVPVQPGQPAQIALALRDALPGRGRIVDAITQKPVMQALVQPYAMCRGWLMKAWRDPIPVDDQGLFDARAFGSAHSYITISATGYAPRKVLGIAPPGQPLDFGVIGLFATQNIDVQLSSDIATDFTQYRGELQREAYVSERAFPPSGALHFASVPPGQYDLRVAFPDNSVLYQGLELLPGRDLHVTVPVRGRGMEVEFVPEPGVDVPHWAYLDVAFTSNHSSWEAQTYGLVDLQPVHVNRIEGESAMLTVFGMDSIVLAAKRVDLKAFGDARVQVRVPKSRARFIVVDATHKPVADARVTLSGVGDTSGWHEHVQTDAQGQCSIAGLALDRVYAQISHASIGVMPSQLIVTADAASSPLELVLAPEGPLSLALVERQHPVSGVQVWVADQQAVDQGLGLLTSNELGIVTGPLVGHGSYIVEVRHPGYWRSRNSIAIGPGGTQASVEVRRLGSVSILIRDKYEAPAPGVRIDLHSDEMDRWVSSWMHDGELPPSPADLTSDEHGQLLVNALPNGTYSWRVDGAEGTPITGTVTVLPNATTSLVVTLH